MSTLSKTQKHYLVVLSYGDEEILISFDESPTSEYIKVHLYKCCDPAMLDYLHKQVDEGNYLCMEIDHIANTYIRHSDYD
jgi:hypothetical protein